MRCSALMLLSILSVFGPSLSAHAASGCSSHYEPSQPVTAVHFNWGTGSPDGICKESFSAAFQQVIQSNGGDYFVQTYTDGQAKVTVAGNPVIDSPGDIEHAVLPRLSSGNHTVKTLFNKKQGKAAVYSDVVPFGSWLAYYYNNTNLQDVPVHAQVIRPEDNGSLTESFSGSSRDGVSKDHFSARYVTAKHLDPGDYVIRTDANEGMKILVDGQAVPFEQRGSAKVHVENRDHSDIHWIEVWYTDQNLKRFRVSIEASEGTDVSDVVKGSDPNQRESGDSKSTGNSADDNKKDHQKTLTVTRKASQVEKQASSQKEEVSRPKLSPHLAIAKRQTLYGIALKSSTPVYKQASISSGVWKSYSLGSILKYETFTSGWYKATVKVGGKWRTGYIKTSDVENKTSNPKTLYGIASKSSTHVYKQASTSLGIWKNYSQGSVLKYETFTSGWYKATVYIKGKKQTGYIKKSDVENKITNPKTLHGIGLKSSTHVYKQASSNSGVWKSYSQGSILTYRTFTSGWYEATIYIKGVKKTGYIKKSDVENKVSKQETIKGIAKKSPTNVYTSGSRKSKVLKSYQRGNALKYKTFVSGWYEAKVYLNGKPVTGYIHADDVNNDDLLITDYNISLNDMLNKQMSTAPQTDQGIHSGYVSDKYIDKKNGYRVSESTLNVRSGPSTSYPVIGSLTKGTQVLIKSRKNGWDYVSFTWANASREDTLYYLDPNNFEFGSQGYFQFLKLSESAGLNANEINQKILKGKGSLAGQGAAFITAAKKYHINEIYLISHALLETGNGTSDLAIGKIKINKKPVYNMYGTGAYDNCPQTCGAQWAYDHQWFTPKDAIIGGAQFVSEKYIQAGQDTLYKMRWNPDHPGTHQYATDIGWAVKQTEKIKKLYDMLDFYTLVFDVPRYH